MFSANHSKEGSTTSSGDSDQNLAGPIDWLSRPLIYLAAPYTLPDPEANVNRVVDCADALLTEGLVIPYVPHLTHLWHERRPRELSEWYAYDLVILARCDAVLRLEGASHGADAEVKFSKEHDIPVFFTVDDLYAWVALTTTSRLPNPPRHAV